MAYMLSIFVTGYKQIDMIANRPKLLSDSQLGRFRGTQLGNTTMSVDIYHFRIDNQDKQLTLA